MARTLLRAGQPYNRPFTHDNLAAAFIWGRNHQRHFDDGTSSNLNGYTGEATVNFKDKNYVYLRLELVDKTELLRPADRTLRGSTDEHASCRIGAYTFGYVRDVKDTGKLLIGLGGDMTFYSQPAALDPLYGNNPTSYRLFIRFRPSRMQMGDHRMHMGQGDHAETPPEH